MQGVQPVLHAIALASAVQRSPTCMTVQAGLQGVQRVL
jgi:hypothetical protein